LQTRTLLIPVLNALDFEKLCRGRGLLSLVPKLAIILYVYTIFLRVRVETKLHVESIE